MNATMRLLSCVLAILIFPFVGLSQNPPPVLPSQVDDFATLLMVLVYRRRAFGSAE